MAQRTPEVPREPSPQAKHRLPGDGPKVEGWGRGGGVPAEGRIGGHLAGRFGAHHTGTRPLTNV